MRIELCAGETYKEWIKSQLYKKHGHQLATGEMKRKGEKVSVSFSFPDEESAKEFVKMIRETSYWYPLVATDTSSGA